MSFEIQTNVTEMRNTENEIRELTNQFNMQQTDLFNEGRELDGMWEGDANESFNMRLRADEPRFNELFTVLGQYADTLRESADDYARTENMIAEEMRNNSTRQSR